MTVAELCFIEIGPLGSAVDDALRTRLADTIGRASDRTGGSPKIRPPTPRTYVYGGDYIDAPLAMKAGQGPSASTYFIHSNSVYSPQVVTDATGQAIERYSYTAYGERTVLGGYSSAASRIGLNFGFTGMRDDGGLLFARNRYFSPELGRFISRDPAGYTDGYGLYAGYFIPSGMDPEGLAATCPGDNDNLGDGDLIALAYELGSSAWGHLNVGDDPREASFAAYQWMDFDASPSFAISGMTGEIANGNQSFNNPMAYFDPMFQGHLLDGFTNYQNELDQQVELEMRRQQVNDMYNMAIDEFSGLLMNGFNPVELAANILMDKVIEYASPYVSTAWDYYDMSSNLATAWDFYGLCFVADTPVMTASGSKLIRDIVIGDVVVSADEGNVVSVGTGVVTAVHKNLTYDLIQVTVGGKRLKGTLSHPFYVKGRGWTLLGNVRPGDLLLTGKNEYLPVQGIEQIRLPKPEWVYNFEVGGSHTYYVGLDDSADPSSFILVHNAPFRVLAGTLRGMSRAAKGRYAEAITRRTMVRNGYRYLKAKLPSNSGFDGIFLKDGVFTIVETKFNSRWRVQMSKLADGTPQMSKAWIEMNILKMQQSGNPDLRKMGFGLESALNKGKIDYRVHVVGPSGGSAWHPWTPQ